jgi:hypothetical protein
MLLVGVTDTAWAVVVTVTVRVVMAVAVAESVTRLGTTAPVSTASGVAVRIIVETNVVGIVSTTAVDGPVEVKSEDVVIVESVVNRDAPVPTASDVADPIIVETNVVGIVSTTVVDDPVEVKSEDAVTVESVVNTDESGTGEGLGGTKEVENCVAKRVSITEAEASVKVERTDVTPVETRHAILPA